jgi:hypothetical protein
MLTRSEAEMYYRQENLETILLSSTPKYNNQLPIFDPSFQNLKVFQAFFCIFRNMNLIQRINFLRNRSYKKKSQTKNCNLSMNKTLSRKFKRKMVAQHFIN